MLSPRSNLRTASALLAVAACPASVASAEGPAIFPSYYEMLPVTSVPSKLAVADFNGDGLADLATPCGSPENEPYDVNVLLGLPDGGFAPPQTYAVGPSTLWIVAEDFNGDGHPDIATAGIEWPGSTVNILINNGDGGFAPATDFSDEPELFQLAAGDIDHDGDVDLVSCGANANEVILFLNDGDGAFDDVVYLPSPTAPYAPAVDDFDGDGFNDIAVANEVSDDLSVYYGDGAGGFPDRVDYAVGGVSSEQDFFHIRVADVNLDDRPDVLITSVSADALFILSNQGGRTFASARRIDGFSDPTAVAVGDLNLDGAPDLAVADNPNDIERTGATILLGQPGGEYGEADFVALAPPAYDVAILDVDGDGIPDIAGSQAFATNLGEGAFRTVRTEAVGDWPTAAAIGDLNGDDYADVATANYVGETVSVLFSHGDGSFSASTEHPGGNFSYGADVALGDVNNDGFLDIAVPGRVLLNDGAGQFNEVAYIHAGLATNVELADFNGDGHLDVVSAINNSSNLVVTLNDGDGSFTALPGIDTGHDSDRFGGPFVADLDGNGALDLLTVDFLEDVIAIIFNDGAANFEAPILLPFPEEGSSPALADFDGDGDIDIAVRLAETDTEPVRLGLLFNNGDGTFEPALAQSLESITPLVPADIDLDGDVDLVTGGWATLVLLNDGSGVFSERPIAYHGRSGNARPALGDIDGDGDLDAIKTAAEINSILVIPNILCRSDLSDDGTVGSADLDALLGAWGPCDDGGGGSPVAPCPADLTNDGVVDADDIFALLANWGECDTGF